MITVQIDGQGQSFRLDTPDPALIGPWLAALFKDISPDPRMPGYWQIHVSGGSR